MTHQPISGNSLPRAGGPGSFMRLPWADTADGLDVAVQGVPMDHGTSWRAGTRFGPQEIRKQSNMLRPYNMGTGAAPFDGLRVADLGDIPINTFNLPASVDIIAQHTARIAKAGAVPLTLGGDHTLSLGTLRGIAQEHGPVGLIHIDAHADINPDMFGEPIAHGTPFRRAYEEGLLRPNDVWQIGLRGTGYTAEDFNEARGWGFHVHQAENLWQKDLGPLADSIRAQMSAGPVYITFDIDSLDPAFAPGTGTPEIAGLTPPQALQLIRGLRGLDVVGLDVVEVSPPYDPSGNTALLGANIAYELMCILPKTPYR